MKPHTGKYFPTTGTWARSDTRANSQANVATKEDVLVTNRRGGRRAQRRAMQHEAAVSTAATAMTSKPMATVVVPVHCEGKAMSGEKCPVNRTSVRRRTKPPNTTVTKVVTGVSLEDLRAKRNGTAAENDSGGDAKTIEEVSRILFMYASRQQQGTKHYFTRHSNAHSNGGNLFHADTEPKNRLDMSEVTTTQLTTATSEAYADKSSPFNKGSFCARDVYTHLLSLIQSGKLPAESLEVLRAVLPHGSRGGKLDTFDVSKKSRPGNGHSGLTAEVMDVSQQMSQSMSDLCGYLPQPPLQQQQQQQLRDSTEGGYFGYGNYTSYTERARFHEMNCHQSVMLPASNPTDVDGVMQGYACACSFLGQPISQKQQPQHFCCRGVSVDGAGEYQGHAHSLEGAVPSGAEHNHGVNNNNGDDDDDDADVTAMLHDIRNVMQCVLSPERPRYTISGNVGAAESLTGDFNDDSDGTFPLTSSLPCVTISQVERDSLRSFQQAFLARMRVTGSPEWKSFGATPPQSNLLHAFADSSGSGGLAMGQQQAEEEQEVDDGWCATNRTLFSYHTTFLEGEDVANGGNDDDREALDELVTRDASVSTAAAATAHREQYDHHFGQHHHFSEKWRWPSEDESQLAVFAMRGGGWQEEEETTTMPTAAAAEEENQLWSWTGGDDGHEWAASGNAATMTPFRRWFRDSETAEHISNSAAAILQDQPTTQKKELILRDGRSPYSPAACDFTMPTHSVASTATMTTPTTAGTISTAATTHEKTKADATPVDCNTVPFVPVRMGA